MDRTIIGLHHITSISSNAKRTLFFYTKVLGQRLVKKTVHPDDPSIYHFYFGNEKGDPGTIITFYNLVGIEKGHIGNSMATHVSLSIPHGSIPFWKERLSTFLVSYQDYHLFEEQGIQLQDRDGLLIILVEAEAGRSIDPTWIGAEIASEYAIQGIQGIRIKIQNPSKLITILSKHFGFTLDRQTQQISRYTLLEHPHRLSIDIKHESEIPSGHIAAGSIKHIAFYVDHESKFKALHEQLILAREQIEPLRRNPYYQYFTLVLQDGLRIQVVLAHPGFTVDEDLQNLGQNLKLPTKYEHFREDIVKILPPL